MRRVIARGVWTNLSEALGSFGKLCIAGGRSGYYSEDSRLRTYGFEFIIARDGLIVAARCKLVLSWGKKGMRSVNIANRPSLAVESHG